MRFIGQLVFLYNHKKNEIRQYFYNVILPLFLWTLCIAIVISILFLAVMKYSEWQVTSLGITNLSERLKSENGNLATLVQIFGGLVLVIGLYFTGMNTRIAQKNMKIAEDGKITDRFSKAVEQLGSDKLEVRLGGIYALERISIDSISDYLQVMEILSAFVRERSTDIEDKKNELTSTLLLPLRVAENNKYKAESKRKITNDIQTVLTVIGRRKVEYTESDFTLFDFEEKAIEESLRFYLHEYLWKLDLSGSNLQRAFLRNANLKEINFYNANLLGADLQGACLSKSNFYQANLLGAKFKSTNLKLAQLENANLMGASLNDAYLYRSNFSHANLYQANIDHGRCEKAIFSYAYLGFTSLNNTSFYNACFAGANLEYSKLIGCWLKGTDLEQANLIGVEMIGVNLTNANLTKANLTGATISSVNLTNANLSEAILTGATIRDVELTNANLSKANLAGVQNLEVNQFSRARSLYQIQGINDELMNQLRKSYPSLFEEPT